MTEQRRNKNFVFNDTGVIFKDTGNEMFHWVCMRCGSRSVTPKNWPNIKTSSSRHLQRHEI